MSTENRPSEQEPADRTRHAAGWERETLDKLLFASLQEQRRTRRWGIFFKSLLFLYLFLLLALYVPALTDQGPSRDPHVALIDVHGIISAESAASAERVVSGLEAAFENQAAEGIILRINSPGGSPVESAYINNAIDRLREEHDDKPVYAVIGDMGASGAYYVAVAADEIFANPSSVVGSIGVMMNNFGFVDTLDMLGVERRLLTAGERKGAMDPFSPMREEDQAHFQDMLDQIHDEFIEAVRKGRGERLQDNPEVFSGLIWSGREALDLGLVDGFASPAEVARDQLELEEVEDYTREPALLDQLFGRVSAHVTEQLLTKSYQLR